MAQRPSPPGCCSSLVAKWRLDTEAERSSDKPQNACARPEGHLRKAGSRANAKKLKALTSGLGACARDRATSGHATRPRCSAYVEEFHDCLRRLIQACADDARSDLRAAARRASRAAAGAGGRGTTSGRQAGASPRPRTTANVMKSDQRKVLRPTGWAEAGGERPAVKFDGATASSRCWKSVGRQMQRAPKAHLAQPVGPRPQLKTGQETT